MNKIVDGSATWAEQENAIRNFEANGFEMVGLSPDTTKPPQNVAAFKSLPIGIVPKRLHLVDAGDPVPNGTVIFWMSTIYVASALQASKAYRG